MSAVSARQRPVRYSAYLSYRDSMNGRDRQLWREQRASVGPVHACMPGSLAPRIPLFIFVLLIFQPGGVDAGRPEPAVLQHGGIDCITVGFLHQRPPRSRVRTMKLSRTVAYAVQATLQLAQAEGNAPVPCSMIARKGRMPERFLLQILRNLVTHGILQSTRGVEGGYALERPPEQISLLEIIEAIDGPLAASVATHEGLSEQTLSRLQQVLEGITAKTRRDLEAIKLADLLPSGKAAN